MQTSYAVYKEEFGNSPTISQVEKYCFNARTRGANDMTKMDVNSDSFSYCHLSVTLKEEDMTSTYRDSEKATAKPVGKSKKWVGPSIAIALWVALVIVLALT